MSGFQEPCPELDGKDVDWFEAVFLEDVVGGHVGEEFAGQIDHSFFEVCEVDLCFFVGFAAEGFDSVHEFFCFFVGYGWRGVIVIGGFGWAECQFHQGSLERDIAEIVEFGQSDFA